MWPLPIALVCLAALALSPTAGAQAPVYPTRPASQQAIRPIPVTELEALLDKELATQRSSGQLTPGSNVGITIGVVQHGVRKIFSYGIAHPDSIFEIGSITKTFTATILAQRVVEGAVRLDEPVRALLPPGTVAKPASGPEITLLDLSDHHSGLPPMPDNDPHADPTNPLADYDINLLYAFIAKHGVSTPPDAPFLYSNLGEGLLGEALANQAGQPYAALLQNQVLAPLRMLHTGVVLTPDMQRHLLQGYSDDGKPARSWDLNALVAAGGIRSNAPDMLTFLEVQLHPDHLPQVVATSAARSLPTVIRMTHVVHAEAFKGMHIALN